MTFAERIKRLKRTIREWINHFASGTMKTVMDDIDVHLRTKTAGNHLEEGFPRGQIAQNNFMHFINNNRNYQEIIIFYN